MLGNIAKGLSDFHGAFECLVSSGGRRQVDLFPDTNICFDCDQVTRDECNNLCSLHLFPPLCLLL